VDIYEDNDLSELHAICSSYHSTLYDFLLMSGFREQEAMHIVWSNVRFNSNIIEMRWKPQFKWTPKAYKEREVPRPDLYHRESYRISPLLQNFGEEAKEIGLTCSA